MARRQLHALVRHQNRTSAKHHPSAGADDPRPVVERGHGTVIGRAVQDRIGRPSSSLRRRRERPHHRDARPRSANEAERTVRDYLRIFDQRRDALRSPSTAPPPALENGPCVSGPHEPSVFVHRRHPARDAGRRGSVFHNGAPRQTARLGLHGAARRAPPYLRPRAPTPRSSVGLQALPSAFSSCVSNVAHQLRRAESTARSPVTVHGPPSTACAC